MYAVQRFFRISLTDCRRLPTGFTSLKSYLRQLSIAGEEQVITIDCSNDQRLIFKTGRLAKFADGTAVAQMGDTSVMVTAVSSKKLQSSAGFLPLTVDFRQKAAAAGRIPTNHLRRELGPSEHEILTSRAIDRSLRPLFPRGYFYETQLVCNLLAVDGLNDPDVLAINAASAALCLSDIPFVGPVGAARVALIDGEPIVHPTRRQMASSDLNLVVSGIEGNKVVMLEAGAKDVYMQDFMKAVKVGMKEVTQIVLPLKKFVERHGKPKRVIEEQCLPSEEMIETARSEVLERVTDIMMDWNHDKVSRDKAISVVRDEALQKLTSKFPEAQSNLLVDAINGIVKDAFRRLVLEKEERMDGRRLTDIRPIFCDVNLLQPLHGSALFQRGQTQVMCTVTFDSPDSALRMRDPVSQLLDGYKEKNFMLHYEFPSYATNEIKHSSQAGRRELGHGNLAERALVPVIPKDFPFTIRLTSEVFESNGSSSMASVCGGTLALLDAGVKLKAPVAGVAMGLVSVPDPENPKQLKDYKILTDILGIEDFLGEMDFKLAGTAKGITALQADIKIPGMPLKVVMETIVQGFLAKTHILKVMSEAMDKARDDPKDNWPVVEKFDVPVHKRSEFIGIGGRNLKRITAETGVTLIPLDNSSFDVFAPNQTALSEAKELMTSILMSTGKEPTLDFGGVYSARIVEIRESGVMVQLYPSMHPTLLPNSQLDQRKVSHPSVLGFEEGQEIQVKYYGRDPVSGAMRLSRKVLQVPPSSIMKNLIQKSE
ncbi:polyribonucleotide nucleotidyltransferase 1, mitochondrial-like isoform X1 [Varroa jacobsoni]|uniref:polyribonucleotide nucleotidyltransferase 1, mitochondrial-like isoform X1 n=1 Tax=Varroa jacobsoni TaxID=62625 RepID=UPI000BF3F5F1|nr:polyribonucleotide nucleotidyltransferase 1, mitochondrial-like isoform X1 [Varroa jacobsoni]